MYHTISAENNTVNGPYLHHIEQFYQRSDKKQFHIISFSEKQLIYGDTSKIYILLMLFLTLLKAFYFFVQITTLLSEFPLRY